MTDPEAQNQNGQPRPPRPPIEPQRQIEHQCLELCPICRTADVLRASGATEMRDGLDELGREALLVLRAAIDHYLERPQGEPGERVEQIPID